MTQKAVETRMRQWTRRPGGAIIYGPFARLSDWWCASRDARQGVPVGETDVRAAPQVPGEGRPAPAANPVQLRPIEMYTPRMMFLGQLGLGRIEREWLRYKAEVADHLAALTEARARRKAAQSAVDLAERERAALPEEPKREQLERRVGGEGRTEVAVIRERRLRQHANRVSSVVAKVTARRSELERHDIEVARLAGPVRIRFEVAQTRAAMISAYVYRRRAAYLTRLVRNHPNGKRINQMVAPGFPERPEWTVGARSPDLSDLPMPSHGEAEPAQPASPEPTERSGGQ